ncbi:MAG: hypothetical protein KDJ65_26055 [Anaerolineae bacterium]|nr:hypothetical protein [Anaerolineae bacterium]
MRESIEMGDTVILVNRSLLEAIGTTDIITFACLLIVVIVGWSIVAYKRSVIKIKHFAIAVGLPFAALCISEEVYAYLLLLMLITITIGGAVILISKWRPSWLERLLGDTRPDILRGVGIAALSLLLLISLGTVRLGLNVGGAVAKGSHVTIGKIFLEDGDIKESRILYMFER